ncbi:MAG TPA: DUF1697 domain-containing protein [Nocardioides sp.]|nr:DUF1697 domain-containing protein [Nocardioides sp.]
MATYLGFLRAINLGPTRKFPKADIVAATEAAGFSDVATHINTGNVRFESRMRSRERIEDALESAYLADRGFEVSTVVFTPAELCAIADEAEDVADGHPGTHYVSLLKKEPTAALAREIEALSTDRDVARVRGRAVHLVITDPYHHAKLSNATIEKQLGVATNRNLKVIRAIAEKWCR